MTLDAKVRHLLIEAGMTNPDPANDYRISLLPDGRVGLTYWNATLPIPMPTDESFIALDTDPAFLRRRKQVKRDAINSEARRRIIARWPMELQQSVNAGLYPALSVLMATDIATIIAESNAARDTLFALTRPDAVEAYDPLVDPGWSDIGTYTQTEPA